MKPSVRTKQVKTTSISVRNVSFLQWKPSSNGGADILVCLSFRVFFLLATDYRLLATFIHQSQHPTSSAPPDPARQSTQPAAPPHPPPATHRSGDASSSPSPRSPKHPRSRIS